MTLNQAILLSLDEIKNLTTHTEVYNHIISKNYYNFGNAQFPSNTISALLGNFIRQWDARVKRISKNGRYFYYLTKNELYIQIDTIDETNTTQPNNNTNTSYRERDLHKLLSTHLKNQNIYSKTIFHEQNNGQDNNQIWSNPDMVGVDFTNLNCPISQKFLKSTNKIDSFKLYSYEIKKEINNDNDLKKAFFQAVSNSSWSNYWYLVAFEFGDNLLNEIKRLNEAFWIGIIQLHANPFESKILFPATYKKLDFNTIDKLCTMNNDFQNFIQKIEQIINTNEETILNPLYNDLINFCDLYFTINDDITIEEYCKQKNIPIENNNLEFNI
jgi:hypothetical protein